MNRNFTEIDYPSRKERREAIHEILDRACPKKESFFRYLLRLYRQVGMEFLLHGMGKIMALMMAVYLGSIFFHDQIYTVQNPSAWLFVTILAPLGFQIPLLISVIGEREQGIYPLQMSCRITAYHILALRMLMAGGFGLVLNGIMAAAAFLNEGIGWTFHVLCLSVTALMAYAVLYLLVLEKTERILAQAVLFFAWCLFHGAVFQVCPGVYEYFALRLPTAVHVGAWVMMGYWGSVQLERWIECENGRRNYAAV